MSLDSGLNLKAAKTELDEIFRASYSEPDKRWGFAHANNTDLFVQKPIKAKEFIVAEHMGPGLFEETGESVEPPETSPRTDNKKTVTVVDFTEDLPISKDFKADDQQGVVERDVTDLGRKARTTQDKKAFNLYADGFSGQLTPDGVAIYSNSHTNLNGDTIDTLETGALSPDNLEVLVRKLYEQKDQRGDLGGAGVAALLVPPALMKKALVYTESELEPEVGDNDRNYISLRFDSLRVYENPYVGGTFNTATNANTSYYAVGQGHGLTRGIRQALDTNLVDWKTDKKRRYMYRADYREVYFAESWEGTVASQGTA